MHLSRCWTTFLQRHVKLDACPGVDALRPGGRSSAHFTIVFVQISFSTGGRHFEGIRSLLNICASRRPLAVLKCISMRKGASIGLDWAEFELRYAWR
jgi:hypothetical protein